MPVYKHAKDGELVNAEQLTQENGNQLAQWCEGVLVQEIDPFDSERTFNGINVPTANGAKRCSLGDYIVKDELNWFYVVARYEFEHTYEKKEL